MKIKPLYRYKREDGKIADSPIKPDREYTVRVRMIASEGKVLTKDGKTFYSMKDDDSEEGWYEITLEEYKEIQDREAETFADEGKI